jgi:hypothetical protein
MRRRSLRRHGDEGGWVQNKRRHVKTGGRKGAAVGMLITPIGGFVPFPFARFIAARQSGAIDLRQTRRAQIPRRPKRKTKPAVRVQYGALPYRFTKDAALEILLVTTRQTRR